MKAVLEAIEPRRLYRQVADQLRAYIDSGACPPGTRLPTERDLADQLGVSRPTIREALIALEVEGRVRIRVGSGIYVLDPPAVSGPRSEPGVEIEGPFEVLRARAFIEGFIAQEAALLASPAHLAMLDDILARMQAATQPGGDSLALDREFHVLLAGILGNPVISGVVRQLFDLRMNPYFGRLAEYFENAASRTEAVGEHRAIREALGAQDGMGAREAMRAHLERSQARFSQSFGEEPGLVARNPPARRDRAQPALRRSLNGQSPSGQSSSGQSLNDQSLNGQNLGSKGGEL